MTTTATTRTTATIEAELNQQIAKAKETLRELTWTAEEVRITLTELQAMKASLQLVEILRGLREAVTT